ncbi:MAG: hypothetical protein JWM21_4811 [Acidobacteria bacterium]|nr:hypothetical protein [Acidobacteriota bacterium]
METSQFAFFAVTELWNPDSARLDANESGFESNFLGTLLGGKFFVAFEDLPAKTQSIKRKSFRFRRCPLKNNRTRQPVFQTANLTTSRRNNAAKVSRTCLPVSTTS